MKLVRNVLTFVLAAALLIGLVPTLPGTPAASAFTAPHDVIRIGLNATNAWRVTSGVTLTNTGGMRLGTYNASRVFVPSADTAHTGLTITASGTTVTIRAGGTTLHSGPGPIAVAPVNASTTTTYALPFQPVAGVNRDTFHFFGGFRFTASGGNLTVVNYVGLEDYLKGVVPYEAIASWPLEALKAQAVAARTFAVGNFGRRGGQGFDLTNTTLDQVYRGMGGNANANTNRSVTETRGRVILHNGRPIDASYHSSSGGATEDAANIWGGNCPVRIGVPDPHGFRAPHRWTETLTAAQFLNHVRGRDSGFNLPDIANVIIENTPMDNVRALTLVASNGAQRSYSGSAARNIISGLRSTNSHRFTIVRNQPLPAAFDAPYVNPTAAETDYDNNLYTIEELYPYRSQAEIEQMLEEGLIRQDVISEEAIEAQSVGGTTFTITNYGFGHNVGMSQWGAYSMARAGYTFEQILRHYYRGVVISSGWPLAPCGFIDVRPGAWYCPAIQYVRERNLISGVGGDRFAPSGTTTRAQFTAILARMEGIRTLDYALGGTIHSNNVQFRAGPGTDHRSIQSFQRGVQVTITGRSGDWFRVRHAGTTGYVSRQFVTAESGTFIDVTAGAWYTPYVEWAARRGVAQGVGGGRFAPDGALTREQMAVLLHNYATRMNHDLPQTANPRVFTDMNAVSGWARAGVTAMQQARVINGLPDGRFNPQGRSTRAQMAEVIANFHRNVVA